MNLLHAESLSCTFPNGTKAVQDFDFDLSEGDLVGLIGPDGAGKTTTFRMLMGLKTPTGGRIERTVAPEDTAYVPQVFAQSPDLTVAENMQLQARLYAMKSPQARITELLSSLDLEPFRDRLAG